MPHNIKDIQTPVSQEMLKFERKFKSIMKSKVSLLSTIVNFIIKQRGKKIRPMLVFLSARLCGDFRESTFRGASLIELLHTATLVHDDIVDGAQYRRGFFSVNALWKNKIAVLVGDYFLSRGLLLSVEHNDFDLLKVLSKVVKQMSEGELLQIEKSRLLNITEEVYLRIIRQKTAALISACCEIGAITAKADENTVEIMRSFGEKIGMVYQIKDDLFDYGEQEIGKPLGIDIREKKMTLPLIYALNHTSYLQRRYIIYQIRNNSLKRNKVSEIINFVKRLHGLEYAQEKMKEYIQEAKDLLDHFPPSIYKKALMDLTTYFVERKK